MSTHSTLQHSAIPRRRPTDRRTATERADRRIGKAVAGVAASGMVVTFVFALLSAFSAGH